MLCSDLQFFRWLHKLGIASRKGHTVVCHETLITFSRGLLDPSFDPQVVSLFVDGSSHVQR